MIKKEKEKNKKNFSQKYLAIYKKNFILTLKTLTTLIFAFNSQLNTKQTLMQP
jgi:hypothetical protein